MMDQVNENLVQNLPICFFSYLGYATRAKRYVSRVSGRSASRDYHSSGHEARNRSYASADISVAGFDRFLGNLHSGRRLSYLISTSAPAAR
ncbi:hypothetical protein [Sphingomonas sp. BAUL-RG-20F-R05-02]|uniref:hypothetical protein n=1 Tax=Sphingomonas sp. BAUL-RG-20F-R05-02 TaxID=2914830 RepID=UPI001F56F75F|nr:hypothetical protein [Sphingomonas sp. BAUL-RG-20F-R05-02]